MYRPFQLGLVSALCLTTPFVMAKGERYGASVNVLAVESIKYDEGSSGDKQSLRYGLVHTRPIDETNNRWRWWLGLNYLQDQFTAPNNGVYQEATNFEFRVVPQFALSSWSVFTPYIGAGLSLGYSQYTNRWKVDDEGFKYGSQLQDIEQFEVGAVATFGAVIKLGSNPDAHLQVIPQLSYIAPIYNNGIGGAELTISLLF